MNFKGEDYYVSELVTSGKTVADSYPWFMIYSFKRFTELSAVKYLKDVYVEETQFFILLLWTFLLGMLTVFAVLPETLMLLFSVIWKSLLSVFLPILLVFGIYIWIGVLLKHFKHAFSTKLCMISCVALELIIEIISVFSVPSSLIATLTITIVMGLVISSGRYIQMNELKSYCSTLLVMSSIITLRFAIIGNQMFQWNFLVPPLLVYACVLSGLSVSTLSSLRIPKLTSPLVPSGRKEHRHLLHEMTSIPVIRQRRASSIEMPTVNQNGVLQPHLKTRRKSLPALGVPTRKVSMSSMDLTILGEAHGMITDLLADSSLPLNVTGTLRIVADMISPLLQHSMHRPPSLGNPLLTVLEKNKNNEDEEQVKNQPDLKDDTPLSLKQRLQRNLGVSSRRMSSSYTTTTSATGMPTIDMEYHTKKSNTISNNNSSSSPSLTRASKKLSHRSKSHAGILTPSERNSLLKKPHSQSVSAAPGNSIAQNISKDSVKSPPNEDIFKVEIERGKPVYFEGMEGTDNSEDDLNESTDEGNDDNETIALLNNNISTATNGTTIMGPASRTKLSRMSETLEEVEEAPEREDSIDNYTEKSLKKTSISFDHNNKDNQVVDGSENDIGMEKENTISSAIDTNILENRRKLSDSCRNPPLAQRNVNLNIAEVAPVRKSSAEDNTVMKKSPRGENLIIPSTNVRRKSSRELHMEYEIAVSMDIDGMLRKVKDWDFPIFELSERCNVLTQLAFRIFQMCDFFKTFQIPEVTFLKFFRALESGYHNIPYHNRIHAADVLHGVYYFTQHRIPGFNTNLLRHKSLSESAENDVGTETASEEHEDDDEDNTYEENEEEKFTYGCICDSMPDLELMALYVAAAMHDFDHPGRTNAFLVATLNSKALLYNDRSVLENHHAAAAWSLLVTNPGLNFLSGLDPADFKRFRFIVIEEILSTDLKKHFDFLTEWNAKISDQGGGLNFQMEADRLLLGQMAIKLADISGPSKEWDLHYRWTERIIEEFYQQGEDERLLGMPTSAYMDRSNPKVPQLQSSFIKHLVQPLYVSYQKAGILPGEWVESESDDEEEKDEQKEDDENDSQSGDETNKSDTDSLEKTKKKVIYNIVLDNIDKNHEKWLEIIAEDEERTKESTDSASTEQDESDGEKPEDTTNNENSDHKEQS